MFYPQMACMEGYIITLITFLHFPFSNASSRCLHKWTKNCVNYNSFDFLRCGFSKVSPWHFYQSTKSHTNCICLAFVQCSMTPVTPETPRLPRLLKLWDCRESREMGIPAHPCLKPWIVILPRIYLPGDTGCSFLVAWRPINFFVVNLK